MENRHLTTAQMIKDEELRSLLRKRGYKVVELAVTMCFGHDPVRQLVSNAVSEMKNAEFGRAFSRSRDGWLRMERFTVEYIARIN